ncbi:MAG: hypothetical protein KF892_24075 [Rhizobacter sp.]|nr:hypothetical protein [Rhizobacter sp.]
MEAPWFILSHRYGGDTSDPTAKELSAALDEVYEENHPSMTRADYEEHPSAYVRYGTDTGPMYVLYIGRSKAATLEQWADQDYGEELSEPLTIENVSRDQALDMWKKLQSGQIEALCSDFNLQGKR